MPDNKVQGPGNVSAAGAPNISNEMKGWLTHSAETAMHTASFTDARPKEPFIGTFVVQKPPHLMIGGSTFTACLVANKGDANPNNATHFFLKREGTMFPPVAFAGPFAIHHADPHAKHSGLTAANFKDLAHCVTTDMAKVKDKDWSQRLPGIDMRFIPVTISEPPKGDMGGTTIRAWFPAGLAMDHRPVDLNKLMDDGAQFFIEKSNTMAPPNGGSHFAGPFSVTE